MLPIMSPLHLLTSSTLMLSTIMMLSSNNWLFLWCGLEVNLLSFIPLMTMSNKFQENEAAAKYFLVQALGSSIILMSSASLWSPLLQMPPSYLITAAIMLKMGMAPCHFWFPSVMSSISWINCMILSTWQKLGPLTILSFIMKSTCLPAIATIIASLNAITGGLMGMNQTKLKSIMAYSSITHMGWMVSPLVLNKHMTTLLYFLMYCILTIPMFMTMYWLSTDTQLQLQKSPTMLNLPFFLIPLIILSISGLPPLLGFFPKLMILSTLMPSLLSLSIMLIIGSMMNMYFYLNLTFSMLMHYPNNKPSIMSTKSINALTLMSTSMLIIPLLIMMYALTLLNKP